MRSFPRRTALPRDGVMLMTNRLLGQARDLIFFLGLSALLALQTHDALAGQNWGSLPPSSQEFLADMRNDWGTLTDTEKRKWLKVAERYREAPPEKQEKMRQRIASWAKLSPLERKQARENFKTLREKEIEHRAGNWQDYQTLDEEQRDRLKDEQKQKRMQTQTNPKLPPGAAAYRR